MGQAEDRGTDARIRTHRQAGAALALLGDRKLRQLLHTEGESGPVGVGGRAGALEIDGTRVFVKRVPLTDLELEPAQLRSTANLFELPGFYQYGIGSAGFGAWRELAAHTLTTHWVLDRSHPGFPLMHHWRVLPDTPPTGFMDEFGGVDGAVAHWDGHPAVRRRLEALGRASHSLVLFLEHLPHTLADWLHHHPDRTGAPHLWAAEELARGARFMEGRGFLHFDAHFRNILTDGRLIAFADFGLALGARFDLTPAERRFAADHRGYDRHYTAAHLLRHHLPAPRRDDTDPTGHLRRWLDGHRPADVPRPVATLLDRHAPTAVVLDEFHRRLLRESKLTPYPRAELERAERRPRVRP
ncbi:protein kinase family protein [Kitasatospora sp. NPDC059795]|uniref:protein kinase family protein n=1 Tax=Kitasatospora sp. NPDC059795 TaxID=3346949 RepID=UPI00364C770F